MIDPNDPLPSGQRISAEDRAQRFVQRLVAPAANPGFAVRVLVPRAWEPLELPGVERAVSATQLTPLGGWQDPAFATAPAIFHVQAIGLPREITAEHFLMASALTEGSKLLAIHPISDTLADALMAQTIKGEPYVVRVAACFDGDRAFVATGLAHRRDYGAYADTFGAMIGSIAIEQPTGRPHVEERVTRTLLDTVAFDAPRSFRALEVPDGTETHRALDLFQKDPSGTFSGLIRVDLDLSRREPSSDDEMIYVAAHLMKRGITLDPKVTDVPVDAADGPVRVVALRKLTGTEADGNPIEAWVALLRIEGAALRVWMIGPTRQIGFLQWATNQRGFRVLLDTLRRA